MIMIVITFLFLYFVIAMPALLVFKHLLRNLDRLIQIFTYLSNTPSCHANLVIAVLSDVPHPRQGLVPALLDNLQVAYLDSGHREVGNLKPQLDRHRLVLLTLLVLDAGEAELRPHVELFAAGKLFDHPNHARLVRNVLDSPYIALEDGRVDIDGHRDDDLDVVGDALLLELRARLHNVLNLGLGEVLHGRGNFDQRLDLRVNAVRHQLEVAVGRHERDQPLRVELVEPHALVELDVFQVDQLVAALLAGHLEERPVVQAELELRHARQVALHFHRTEDLRPQDGSVAADEEVELLYDVEEDLILRVLDALRPPADCVRRCRRDI